MGRKDTMHHTTIENNNHHDNHYHYCSIRIASINKHINSNKNRNSAGLMHLCLLLVVCSWTTPATAFALSSPTRQHYHQHLRSITPRRNFLLLQAVPETKESSQGKAPPFQVTLEGEYSYKEAIQRTMAWVGAAGLFGSALWALQGSQAGEEFFAGYLVEQSLSVDNLFVFLLLFEYFRVPLLYQDRVLNWGIYGAITMRAVMIALGEVALQNFRGVLLLFAGILVYGSAKFFWNAASGDDDDDEEDPNDNSIIQFSKSIFDFTDSFDGERFFTVVDGVRKATPLFVCMVAVEISDVVFAIDSIPAVFGVTENPFIVYTSNIFAIMGLRSLYTILSKAATDLKYLEPAVALVLGFIGSKMIAQYFDYAVPTNVALGVVVTLLGVGVGASVVEKQQQQQQQSQEED